MSEHRITLLADARPLLARLARAEALLAAPEVSPEIREGLLGLLDAPEQAVAFKVNSLTATDAVELIVQLDPSDRFLGLLLAGGAGNVH